MKDRYDIVIIGGGIAGISAALSCRNRGKSTAVVANGSETSSLYKAETITNYPGILSATGREIAELLEGQLASCGADLVRGRALSVMPIGREFGVAVGSEFLGRGVSYCATCDGMLYRGKTVALIGSGEEAEHDAAFLESIGCTLLRFAKPLRYEIRGGMKADTLMAGGEEHKVDGIFIIKDTVSVTKLVPGLEYSDGGIVVDRQMRTNVPGVFAAGDCTGKPYQLAKAAGEGNVAALSACAYIDNKEKEK